MTLNLTAGGGGRLGIRDDLRALSTKQRVAIIAAIAIALILEVLGLGASCLGFLVIAVVLYMIPHLLKVTSVKVKAFTGAVFIVVSLLVGVFAYMTVPEDYDGYSRGDDASIRNPDLVDSDGVYTFTFEVNPDSVEVGDSWEVHVYSGDVSMVSFGVPLSLANKVDHYLAPSELTETTESGWYSGTLVLSGFIDGKLEFVRVLIEKITYEDGEERNEALADMGAYYDTGVSYSDSLIICFFGSGYSTLMISILFFVILGFSAFFRGKAEKERTKMEAEGRLYPKGYGLCKNCGTVVLPGEVVCRKCGAYIDVPDEMRPKKKDFFTCSVCGAEVPGDAVECPKCGARFDEETETEVEHPDGTVDVTDETVPCPHCGESIPSNADWCPKCGKKVR